MDLPAYRELGTWPRCFMQCPSTWLSKDLSKEVSQQKSTKVAHQIWSSLPTNLCLDVNRTKLRILRMVIAKFCACETFVRFHHNATIAPKTLKYQRHNLDTGNMYSKQMKR